MSKAKPEKRNPWFWVPSLYYAEGIPYVVVMAVSVIMYKRLGISNTDIALYTSWLYLPWVIKPLWSPFVDIIGKKRNWIVLMQLLIGGGLAGVALTLPLPNFFQYSLAFLWLLAFSSATHDIAADGFYMLGLSKHSQAWFVGIRSTFYRLSMITGQGLLVILAGLIESSSGLPAVNFNVETKTDIEYEQFIHPDSVNFNISNSDLKFITSSSSILVSTQKRNVSEADSVLKFVSEWNISNGYYQALKTETDIDTSWIKKNLVLPVESFIRNNFGEEISIEQDGNLTSNIAAAYVRLNTKPPAEEKIVLNLSFNSGDESISIIEGTRFEFNSHNWNKPGIVLFKLHPNLNKGTTASFEGLSGNIPLAWSFTFFVLTGLFIAFFIYHKFVLPYPAADVSVRKDESNPILKEFGKTFSAFFKKKNIGIILGFILLYRLAESQLVKIAAPFLLDSKDIGGIALTTSEIGLVYGTVGVACLTIGGIVGGIVIAKHGLKFWLWPMIIAINLPDLVYVFLAYTQTSGLWMVSLMVGIEQLGYGFGFTAYMLFLIYISDGEYKTSHYAIATGFMALGMMIPGMWSGWLQELIGYQNFFIWICIATIPGFIMAKLVKIDPEFGKKSE